ncbi:MAG: DUF1802 family protein [Methylacidiphilaceae bacterium]|nr:DUF1802 family protein [Candidatus Methylacidiphilaceae bacterium]
MSAGHTRPAQAIEWPALKEAEPIVRALGKGLQSLILRKGGIAEGRSGFAASHADFWLLPTRFHVQADKIRPEFRFLAEAREGVEPDAVELQYVAKLAWSRWIADWSLVRRLVHLQLWEEELLRERFAYGGKEGLHLLMVRVYRSEKVVCPWERNLGGCRSWVAVGYPWSEALRPVLSNEQFDSCVQEAVAAAQGG